MTVRSHPSSLAWRRTLLSIHCETRRSKQQARASDRHRCLAGRIRETQEPLTKGLGEPEYSACSTTRPFELVSTGLKGNQFHRFGRGVPTNILVQFEMIELIEGFLLVFPAHVYSSSLRNFQHPMVVSISRSPAG